MMTMMTIRHTRRVASRHRRSWGAQVPDTIASVAMAKRGLGPGAVANAVGSQIINVSSHAAAAAAEEEEEEEEEEDAGIWPWSGRCFRQR
jgi:hypothetical protein